MGRKLAKVIVASAVPRNQPPRPATGGRKEEGMEGTYKDIAPPGSNATLNIANDAADGHIDRTAAGLEAGTITPDAGAPFHGPLLA